MVMAAGAATAAAPCPGLLDRTVLSLLGEPVRLCRFAGKVVLAVNTASRCGFTPQYEGLEKLYERFHAEGLVVLGFPANDFGGQEPGSNAEIASFCQVNYGVSFPTFDETSVVGRAANPLFVQLAKASGSSPRWNFHKYWISRNGGEVLTFDSTVSPDDRRLVAQIERLLAPQ